ncbi:glycosyltransferase family 4 protein [Nisaea nitritireducens]|uniref:glycosyltransferase family 4 protein n=1 Tax=Nisaea nitritireducens TaxID=568392 RepID=UPI001865F729|nr:glycosyltransferase family 4 protein [Nisaea nitritireducens]
MRIAFYAPLKSPDAPTPSGDRRMARLLIAALRSGGHDVFLASRLRSRDGEGDPVRQAHLARLGARYADRFVECCQSGRIAAPDLWFSYHLYYKAPDLIGPEVARRLGVPYVVAEASNAPKRAEGPWADSHRRILDALDKAALVIGFNSRDKPCVAPCLGSGGRYLEIKPFLDGLPYPADPSAGPLLRAELGIAENEPLLLAVGMMRPGVKTESYRILAEALSRVPAERRWALAIAGDGAGRSEVEACFAPHQARVHLLGMVDAARLRTLYQAADIFVWPAINEAYGMALLEAQASGLPVVAGDVGGVPDIVRDGATGLLSPEGDVTAFAGNLDRLLLDMDLSRALGAEGRKQANRHHSLESIAGELSAAVQALPC